MNIDVEENSKGKSQFNNERELYIHLPKFLEITTKCMDVGRREMYHKF